MNILMLDDQLQTVQGYALALKRNAYTVEVVGNADDAKKYILSHRPAIAILDVNLLDHETIARKKREQEAQGLQPFVDEEGGGFEVAAWIRTHAPTTGIVMLTSERTLIDDQVRGLDVGADVYIEKTTSHYAFCAQIRALMRRLHPRADDILKIGLFEYDAKARVLSFRGGAPVGLTDRESKLLECLCEERGEVVSRERIYRYVFGAAMPGRNDRAVDTLVSKIRSKAESDLGGDKFPVEAIYGAGYKLLA
jgi:DNA-binding response OmpR family regulator